MDHSGEHQARRRLDKIPEGEPNLYPQVVAGLKKIYKEKILPVEMKYKFDEFHSPFLRDTDFEAKPLVLLLGQYSTGKTSFIEFMLDQPFPGSRIGPEPTTDRFVQSITID
jgi:EH domain-containing protein 1